MSSLFLVAWASRSSAGLERFLKAGNEVVLETCFTKGDFDVKHKILLALATLLLAHAVSVGRAAEFPEASEIIQTEGQFIFTDGSSYYMFKKDGTFTSEPLGISGREINGKWELRDDHVFVIRGRWTWINGLSPRDDYRQMEIWIYRPMSAESVPQLSSVDGALNVKVYQCYFVVDQLIKIPKPN